MDTPSCCSDDNSFSFRSFSFFRANRKKNKDTSNRQMCWRAKFLFLCNSKVGLRHRSLPVGVGENEEGTVGRYGYDGFVGSRHGRCPPRPHRSRLAVLLLFLVLFFFGVLVVLILIVRSFIVLPHALVYFPTRFFFIYLHHAGNFCTPKNGGSRERERERKREEEKKRLVKIFRPANLLVCDRTKKLDPFGIGLIIVLLDDCSRPPRVGRADTLGSSSSSGQSKRLGSSSPFFRPFYCYLFWGWTLGRPNVQPLSYERQ